MRIAICWWVGRRCVGRLSREATRITPFAGGERAREPARALIQALDRPLQ